MQQIKRKTISFFAHSLMRIGVNFDIQNNSKLKAMQKAIHELGSIKFKLEFYPDGSWTAESTNIDGIITGSENTKKISQLLRDAIFTYFEIPAHLCNDKLIRVNNEPITLTQEVYA